MLWPAPATKPRPEVARYFERSVVVTRAGSLCGALLDLEEILRTIEDVQRRRHPSRLVTRLAPVFRWLHRLLAAGKPRPIPPRSSGVAAPWID